MSNAPYDPYIPAGQSPGAGGQGSNATARIQEEIDKTTRTMRDNIDKVAQRGEHVNQLQDKTEVLSQSAQHFRRGANQVRKKMWWKDMKMRIWLIIGVIVLLAVIIIPAVLATRNK